MDVSVWHFNSDVLGQTEFFYYYYYRFDFLKITACKSSVYFVYFKFLQFSSFALGLGWELKVRGGSRGKAWAVTRQEGLV